MYSTTALIGAVIDDNTSAVLLVVGSWDTTADGVPCADGSIACSGASTGSD